MPASDAPVLPPRDESDKALPPILPPRNSSDTSTTTTIGGGDTRSHYGFTDSVSVISIIRQIELYSSPQLNESSDLITTNNNTGTGTGTDNLRVRLDTIKSTFDTDDDNNEYWIGIIQDYSNQFIRTNDKIDEFETHLVAGIPAELRSLVYLKTLQIRYKLNHKETFESLIKKAKYSTSNKNHESYIKSLSLDSNTQDIVEVYNYYINEVVTNTSLTSDSSIPYNVPSSFIISAAKVVTKIAHLEKDEVFYVLLKLDKLFHSLIKEEFYYKINRSLEDLLHKVFLHISVQGIYLNDLYKDILFNFFEHRVTDLHQLQVILDFIVFEGFDFILRYILSVFVDKKEEILKLEGDELSQFLYSSKFFEKASSDLDVTTIVKSQPQLIKYENEYHLIHANSLNNNQNELTNLQEVNDDLLIKINELNRQLENLRTTHSEISQQSDQFNVQLDEAQGVNRQLTDKMNGIHAKIKELTMEDNLNNTIQANKDFEERNSELEDQIQQLKNSIETKKQKLAKLAPATPVAATPIVLQDNTTTAGVEVAAASLTLAKESESLPRTGAGAEPDESESDALIKQSDTEIFPDKP